MQKLSKQTKSFIFLFGFAIFGTYLCLALWSNTISPSTTPVTIINYGTFSPEANRASASTTLQSDTSGWKAYANPDLHISFSYKPDWKILPVKTMSGFTVLQIDPGAKYYNIKIYLSPKGFYEFDGLPTTSETIDNKPALNVQDALYGIKANNLFYTFDVGLSMSLVPDFDALVHSAKFEN
jgi:hypothetical protein